MMDEAVGHAVGFSSQEERGTEIVMNFAAGVGRDAVVHICHTTSGGTVPGDLGIHDIHLHGFVGADALVAVGKSLHIFQVDAKAVAVDVEAVVGGMQRGDVFHGEVGAGDVHTARQSSRWQVDFRSAGSLTGRPAEIERAVCFEPHLPGLQCFGCHEDDLAFLASLLLSGVVAHDPDRHLFDEERGSLDVVNGWMFVERAV